MIVTFIYSVIYSYVIIFIDVLLCLILRFVVLKIIKLTVNREYVNVYDINGNLHEEKYVFKNGIPQHNIKNKIYDYNKRKIN